MRKCVFYTMHQFQAQITHKRLFFFKMWILLSSALISHRILNFSLFQWNLNEFSCTKSTLVSSYEWLFINYYYNCLFIIQLHGTLQAAAWQRWESETFWLYLPSPPQHSLYKWEFYHHLTILNLRFLSSPIDHQEWNIFVHGCVYFHYFKF